MYYNVRNVSKDLLDHAIVIIRFVPTSQLCITFLCSQSPMFSKLNTSSLNILSNLSMGQMKAPGDKPSTVLFRPTLRPL